MRSTRSPHDSTASAHEKPSMRVCMIRTIWKTVSRKRGNRQRINQIYCGLRIKGMHAAEGAILPNANGSRMRRAAKSPQTRGEGKQHEIQTTRRIIKKKAFIHKISIPILACNPKCMHPALRHTHMETQLRAEGM